MDKAQYNDRSCYIFVHVILIRFPSEMERIDVNLLGVSEMKWTGMRHFKSDNHEV